MSLFNVVGIWLIEILAKLQAKLRRLRKPRRVLLFIDFDGVLHPYGETDYNWQPFEQAPRLVKALASRPHVKVVVHSSWRRGGLYGRRRTTEQLRVEFCERLGLRDDQLLGLTTPQIQERWPSIMDWLRYDNKSWPPPPYLILDDMWYAFPHEIRENNMIACKPATGMTEVQWLEMERRLDEMAW